ncbi:MAG: methyltransferase [Acidimicrobiales bacterium]
MDALAVRTGLTRRGARISADAMVALGLLERDSDLYRNGPAASQYLAGRGPADLRPLLRFWDTISYPTWQALAEALGSGPPRQVFDLDEAQQAVMSAGIEAILAGPAHTLPEVIDFTARRRLLDVGCGTGSWSMATVRRHPHLDATVFELPVTADIARARIAEVGLTHRISVAVGGAMTDDLPAGFDVFLVANLVHYWSPADNLAAATHPPRRQGGRVPLARRLLDRPHSHPAGPGRAHGRRVRRAPARRRRLQRREVRAWLPQADWRFVDHTQLARPQSVIVAEAD